jgi:hypothetical protein
LLLQTILKSSSERQSLNDYSLLFTFESMRRFNSDLVLNSLRTPIQSLKLSSEDRMIFETLIHSKAPNLIVLNDPRRLCYILIMQLEKRKDFNFQNLLGKLNECLIAKDSF